GAGGSATGGTGGGSGAGYFFDFNATIGAKSISNKCTQKTDAFAVDAIGMVKAGLQFNIGCPGVIGTMVKNGGCYVVIKEIDKLPAGAYSFTLADANGSYKKWEIQCQQPAADGGLTIGAIFAKTATISGKWDPTTKEIEGSASATWEDGGAYKPAGTTTVTFKGKVP
ncbi:MAG: hypothetical protein L6Q84_26270, partial [Polyangiaceae bacterium]|nr:hypothetical protein [Polyangiaceae bacterium]